MKQESSAANSSAAGTARLASLISGSRHRWQRQLRKTVRRIAHDHLQLVVIPDGLDGKIQLDYLLLTARGLFVLDVKSAEGMVFAGDNMDRWTVMSGRERFTLTNPIGGLQERVEAVSRLTPDIPVHGRVVFAEEVQFPAGQPQRVVTLPELREEFSQGEGPAGNRSVVDAFYAAWLELRKLANPV